MNGSDLMQAALTGATTGPVAVAPLYQSLYFEPCRRKALARVLREMVGGEGELTLSAEQMNEALLRAWTVVWEAQADRAHWMPVQWGMSRAGAEGCRVVVTADQALWFAPGADTPAVDYDAFFDNRHGDVFRVDGPQTVAAVDAALPLTPAARHDDCEVAFHRAFQECYGAAQALHSSSGSPFWVAYGLWGFAGYMEILREQPALIHRACERYRDQYLQYARGAWDLGYRVMFVEECFTGSDIISPRDFAEVSWPYTRDLLAGLKEVGFQVVFYLTGGVEGRLEHLAASAADALAFEESKKAFVIDLGAIRREIGPEKVLFGNVDVVLVRDGTEAQIREEVQRQYAAAGPRYVVSIGSPLTLDTEPEKLEMLVRSARDLR